jgi:hypothetical protein
MKNMYLSLLALVALCAASQAQAMEKNTKTIASMRTQAKQKYQDALKKAGENSDARTQAKNAYTHVSDKINAYQTALDRYSAEQDAEAYNVEYNPQTSHTMHKLNTKKDDAITAYKKTYGAFVQ